jgi:hypothetical protein
MPHGSCGWIRASAFHDALAAEAGRLRFIEPVAQGRSAEGSVSGSRADATSTRSATSPTPSATFGSTCSTSRRGAGCFSSSARAGKSLDELGRNHRRRHVQVPQNRGTMKSMARVCVAPVTGLCLGLATPDASAAQTVRYVTLVHGGTHAGHQVVTHGVDGLSRSTSSSRITAAARSSGSASPSPRTAP